MDRRRMDVKEQTKNREVENRDGKRTSMNEMRVGVKKNRGEGINRKAKKEWGKKIIKSVQKAN